MNRQLLFLMLLLCSALNVTAQHRTCSSKQYLNWQIQQDPSRALQLQQIQQHTANVLSRSSGARSTGGIITIPVVVHVLYNNSTENISDAQIFSQIAVLNEDFRRLNSNADNTWSQAADAEIEFCLATKDPGGNPSTGITRTFTSVTEFSDATDDMKFTSSGGQDAWPASSYLNIWVCDLGWGLGFAQFPGGPALMDGVVINYIAFGTIGTATPPFNLGRTATHEVGHWLNLEHVWGDDGGNCSQDDFIADTPLQGAENYGCPSSPHISCGNGPNGDMFQNYMDYTDDACMNLFTQGQKTRMKALFASGGSRVSLLTSTGCSVCTNDSQCDDSDACTADDCDLVSGCIYSPLICNDNDGCTTDDCEPLTGCTATTVVCDDGFACTLDSCISGLCIQDSTNCTVIISGAILTESGTPVSGVTVTITGSENESVITGSDGIFSFEVALGGSYVVTPSKKNDITVTNGITTLDLVFTQRQILAIQPLVSPYKMIAADVNESGSVTTLDLAFSRSVIIAKSNSFSGGRLWEFIPSDYVFPNPGNPFPFEKSRSYTNLDSDQSEQNFIGVKLGDVNNSWDAGTP